MPIFIISYFITGICLFFFKWINPFLGSFKEKFIELKKLNGQVEGIMGFVLYLVLVFLMFILLYPVQLIELCIKIKKKSLESIQEKSFPYKGGLTYNDMLGVGGHIFCNHCSYLIYINICILGFKPIHKRKEIKTSYHCPNCGEFKNMKWHLNMEIPRCHCGGKLNKEHVLFCPKCRSKDISYAMYVPFR